MKKLLLSAIVLANMGASAQTVNNFYTNDAANTEATSYIIASGTANESTAGENVTWDFSALANAGVATTQVLTATTVQSTLYPGTQLAVESTGEYNGAGSSATIDIFTTGAGVITGFDMDGISLNYVTDNATLGTFPLQYGYNNTDQIAGTFQGMGYTGTFTGTCTTSVDAYGTIITSLASVSGTLTRLKIVQDINLFYLGFPAGTVSQTFYIYYSENFTVPMVRSMATTADIPALNFNYDVSSIEIYGASPIGGTGNFNKNTVSIVPNPAGNLLHFTNGFNAARVTVTDAAGRTVLSGAGNDLDISSLNSGVYFANVTAGTGSQTVKFIKK